MFVSMSIALKCKISTKINLNPVSSFHCNYMKVNNSNKHKKASNNNFHFLQYLFRKLFNVLDRLLHVICCYFFFLALFSLLHVHDVIFTCNFQLVIIIYSLDSCKVTLAFQLRTLSINEGGKREKKTRNIFIYTYSFF